MKLQPRLVIVEGIMGSGKSTTARWIAARMEEAGLRALAITERIDPHPVRGTDGLEHWFQPWLDVTTEGLADRCLAKWRSFVAEARVTDTIYALDGQLFHGDLTNLFLMGASRAEITKYCETVADIARPLAPLLIYFYQADIGRAINAIAAERGEEWVKYQLDWKLQTPYNRRLGLSGVDGLVTLYKEYRALTDELYSRLDMPKLAIDNSQQAWDSYYQLIDARVTGTVSIRRATTEDAGRISAFINALAQAYIIGEFPAAGREHFLRDHTTSAVHERLAGDFRFHIAESGGKLAAVAAIRSNTHLYYLFVDTPFQRMGLARRLWAQVKEEALALGNPGAFTVNTSNYAVPAYERLGFRRTEPTREKNGVLYNPMRFIVDGASDGGKHG